MPNILTPIFFEVDQDYSEHSVEIQAKYKRIQALQLEPEKAGIDDFVQKHILLTEEGSEKSEKETLIKN